MRRIVDDLRWLGYERLNFKSDNEPSILELKRAVQDVFKGEIIPEESPVGESQSNGKVEAGIQSVEGQARTMLKAFEERYGVVLDFEHPIFPWLVEHAGNLLCKYGPGRDGRAPYTILEGKPPKGALVEFGEGILFRPSGSP